MHHRHTLDYHSDEGEAYAPQCLHGNGPRDVDKFNKYSRNTVEDLRAKGQVVMEDGLLIWAFRGYEVNPDPKLADYYKKRKTCMTKE